jgi:hypothetical protein
MHRWVSICGITTLVLVGLHVLVSFYPDTKTMVWRPIDDPLMVFTTYSGDELPQVHSNETSNELETDNNEVQNVPDIPTRVQGNLEFKGKDVLLVVGTDGRSQSHQVIEGQENMVRENRQQYAEYHGTLFLTFLD